MTNQHPITPPPELVQQWHDECHKVHEPFLVHIANQAARWGADQELEACCAEVLYFEGKAMAKQIREARRPKPPTLKEQALRILVENGTTLDGRIELEPEDIPIILKALEQLPND